MARIRTVKPEFWSHPIMCRQSDATRLLALALLNYADDEGYFLAEAAAVRSFARPFDDDSTMIRRSIDDLSNIGYISLIENPEMGRIGKIISFATHQRVDRPNSSKIKKYYDSTINRRSIDDQSSTEQGTGNREQGKEETPSAGPSANGNGHHEIDSYMAAQAFGELAGFNGTQNLYIAKQAMETWKRRKPEMSMEQVPEQVLNLWREYDALATHGKVSMKTFLGELGRFMDSDSWKGKPEIEKKKKINPGPEMLTADSPLLKTKDGRQFKVQE